MRSLRAQGVIPFALVAASMLAADGATAQTISGSYSRNFGNNYLGGRVEASATLSSTTGPLIETSTATSHAQATGYFLRRSFELARADFYASRTKFSRFVFGSGHLSLDLAGHNVFFRNLRRSGTWFYRWTTDAFAQDPSYTFGLGPAHVTISGNVGVGVEARLQYSIANNSSIISASGHGKGWGYGRATARLGFVVGSFSADLRTTFANQTLTLQGSAAPNAVHGSAVYTLQAIALKIWVRLKILFWNVWTKTLVNYQSPVHRRTFFNVN